MRNVLLIAEPQSPLLWRVLLKCLLTLERLLALAVILTTLFFLGIAYSDDTKPFKWPWESETDDVPIRQSEAIGKCCWPVGCMYIYKRLNLHDTGGPETVRLELDFNRVTGLYGAIRLNAKPILGKTISYNRVWPSGMIGYGASSAEYYYMVGLNIAWLGDESLLTGANYYYLIDSKENGLVNDYESMLYSLFLKDRIRDYFGKKGINIKTSYNFFDFHTVQLMLEQNYYSSMVTNTSWNMSFVRKSVDDNPAIDSGYINSVSASYTLNTTDNALNPSEGTYVNVLGEYSSDRFGSDFYYFKYTVDVRQYYEFNPLNRFNFRILHSGADRDLPKQKSYELGGIGTLRGYNFKEFSGSRAYMMNIEYAIGWEFQGLIFADAGFVSTVNEPFDIRKVLSKNSVGMGIQYKTASAFVRLEAARRLDTSSKTTPILFYLRLMQTF